MIFAEDKRDNSRQKSRLDVVSDYQNLLSSTMPEELFGALRDTICGQPSHEARVRLSGFDLPHFDMMFSLCGVDLWHPLYIGYQTAPNMEPQGFKVFNLCSELKRSRSHKKKESRLLLCEKTLLKLNQPQHRVKASRAVVEPTHMTLRQVLQDEETSRGAGLHHPLLLKRKKTLDGVNWSNNTQLPVPA